MLSPFVIPSLLPTAKIHLFSALGPQSLKQPTISVSRFIAHLPRHPLHQWPSDAQDARYTFHSPLHSRRGSGLWISRPPLWGIKRARWGEPAARLAGSLAQIYSRTAIFPDRVPRASVVLRFDRNVNAAVSGGACSLWVLATLSATMKIVFLPAVLQSGYHIIQTGLHRIAVLFPSFNAKKIVHIGQRVGMAPTLASASCWSVIFVPIPVPMIPSIRISPSPFSALYLMPATLTGRLALRAAIRGRLAQPLPLWSG